jgi:hypothetical protein
MRVGRSEYRAALMALSFGVGAACSGADAPEPEDPCALCPGQCSRNGNERPVCIDFEIPDGSPPMPDPFVCRPKCRKSQVCEVTLKRCDAGPCSLVPTCVTGSMDRCALVDCRTGNVCAVKEDGKPACVPHPY